MSDCKAYKTASGEMVCNRCGYVWDADDKEPPLCKETLGYDLIKFNEAAIQFSRAVSKCFPTAEQAIKNIREVLKK